MGRTVRWVWVMAFTLVVPSAVLAQADAGATTPTAQEPMSPASAIRAGVTIDGLLGDELRDTRAKVRRTLEGMRSGSRVTAALAGLTLAEGDADGAKKLAKKAIKQNKKDPEAQYVYARSLAALAMNPETSMINRMRYGGAFKDAAEAAIKHDPKHSGAYELLISFHTYAPGIAGGRKSKARKLLEELERFDAERAASLSLSLVLAEEDWDDARSEYARLIASEALDEEAKRSIHGRYAQAMIYSKEDYAAAEPVLRAYEASSDEDAWMVHYLWGVVDQKQRRWDASIERFETVLELDAPARQTHLLLGQSLESAGRTADAVEHFELFLRKHADHEKVDDAKKAIKRLRKR